MAFVANSITGKIDLDGRPSVEAIKAVAGESGKMAEAVVRNANQASEMSAAAAKRGAESEVRTYKEKLESLKSMAGRRSAFGETMELLAGGGAIMGFSIAAEKMGEMVKGATELKQQLAEGKINSFDMAEGFAKMIPVFGQFYSLGRSIRDVFTGEKEEMAEVAEEAQKSLDAFERHKSMLREIREEADHYKESLHQIEQEISLIGKSGLARDFQEIDNNMSNVASRAWNSAGIAAMEEQLKGLHEELGKLGGQPAVTAKPETEFAYQGEGSYVDVGAGDDEIKKQQDAAAKWAAEHTRILQEINDLEAKMKAASEGAFSVTATAGVEGMMKKIDALSQKGIGFWTDWVNKAKESAEASAKALDRTMDDIRKQADQAGMTDSQKKLDDLKRGGASQKQLDEASKDLSKIDEQKKIDDMKSAAKALHESLETPTEKLNDTVAKYKQMLKEGPLSQEDYDRATLKASLEALGGNDAVAKQGTAALIRSGSAESQAAAYASKYDKNSIMESLAKQQLAKLSIVADHVGTLAGHTNEQPDTLHNMTGIG